MKPSKYGWFMFIFFFYTRAFRSPIPASSSVTATNWKAARPDAQTTNFINDDRQIPRLNDRPTDAQPPKPTPTNKKQQHGRPPTSQPKLKAKTPLRNCHDWTRKRQLDRMRDNSKNWQAKYQVDSSYNSKSKHSSKYRYSSNDRYNLKIRFRSADGQTAKTHTIRKTITDRNQDIVKEYSSRSTTHDLRHTPHGTRHTTHGHTRHTTPDTRYKTHDIRHKLDSFYR